MEPLGAHPLGPFEAAGTLLGVTGGRPEELLVRGVGVLLLLDGPFEVGILGPVLLGPILTFLGIVGNGGGDGVVGAWLLAGVIPHVQVRAWWGGKANSLITTCARGATLYNTSSLSNISGKVSKAHKSDFCIVG